MMSGDTSKRKHFFKRLDKFNGIKPEETIWTEKEFAVRAWLSDPHRYSLLHPFSRLAAPQKAKTSCGVSQSVDEADRWD